MVYKSPSKISKGAALVEEPEPIQFYSTQQSTHLFSHNLDMEQGNAGDVDIYGARGVEKKYLCVLKGDIKSTTRILFLT